MTKNERIAQLERENETLRDQIAELRTRILLLEAGHGTQWTYTTPRVQKTPLITKSYDTNTCLRDVYI